MKHLEAKAFYEATQGRIHTDLYPQIRGMHSKGLLRITVVRDQIVGVTPTVKGQQEYDRHVQREIKKATKSQDHFIRQQQYLAAAVF